MVPPVPATFQSDPSHVSHYGSPRLPSSLLGWPPSPSKSSEIGPEKQTEPPVVTAEEESPKDLGLDALVAKICATVEGQNAEDWIINEKMEAKEALMMDGEGCHPSGVVTRIEFVLCSAQVVAAQSPSTSDLLHVTAKLLALPGGS